MQSTLRNYKARKQDPSYEILLDSKIHDLKMCGILIETDEERIVNYFEDNGLYQRTVVVFSDTIYIDAQYSKTYTFTFTTTNNVCVEVDGDGSTDVDVYVYDANYNEIAKDINPTDICSCVFTPQEGAEYNVRIQNLGSKSNLCKIRVE